MHFFGNIEAIYQLFYNFFVLLLFSPELIIDGKHFLTHLPFYLRNFLIIFAFDFPNYFFFLMLFLFQLFLEYFDCLLILFLSLGVIRLYHFDDFVKLLQLYFVECELLFFEVGAQSLLYEFHISLYSIAIQNWFNIDRSDRIMMLARRNWGPFRRVHSIVYKKHIYM